MKSLYSFSSRVQTASTLKLSESLATNPTENLLKKFILRTAGVLALFLFLAGGVFGQCTYRIQLLDSYGDGWNGGVINTVKVAGVTVIEYMDQ